MTNPYLHTARTALLLAAAIVGAWSATPNLVSAAGYTWGGQHFDTFEAYTAYLRTYLTLWREVHDGAANSTAAQTVAYVPAAPVAHAAINVSTNFVRDVGMDRARFVGDIDLERSSTATVWFEYATQETGPWSVTAPETIGTSFGSQTFDATVPLLRQNTKYYYRAVGADAAGVRTYGETRAFWTLVDPNNDDAMFKVFSDWPTDVRDDRATMGGHVDFRATTYGYVWLEYGTEKEAPENTVGKTLVYGDPTKRKDISWTIKSLTPDTTYYFRLVGEDVNGTRSYGQTFDLRTRPYSVDLPTVRTGWVQDVGPYSAALTGDVDMNDYSDGVVYFVYGESEADVNAVTTDYTRASSIKAHGDALQSMVADYDLSGKKSYFIRVANLDLNTRYFYAIGLEYWGPEGRVLVSGGTGSFVTQDITYR